MAQCSARTLKGRRCKLHTSGRSKRCAIHNKRRKVAKHIGKYVVIEGVKYSLRRYARVKHTRRIKSFHFNMK